MSYTTDVYLITCITNMHAGSGEANYGVVDNLVQRDPVTEIPIIHSSSLKGALREHFKNIWEDDEGFDKLNYVFGKDPSRNGGETETGYYKFFDANLIVLPVRSNVKPFFRATSNIVLNEVNERGKALGKELNISPFDAVKGKPKIEAGNNGCILEDYEETEPGLRIDDRIRNILGNDLAYFHVDDFKELTNRLPVIARNQLENGQSKNLWYEEVVPRESRFIFFISKNNDTSRVSHEEFDGIIKRDTIQIGGNASIGYGYTKIIKLS